MDEDQCGRMNRSLFTGRTLTDLTGQASATRQPMIVPDIVVIGELL